MYCKNCGKVIDDHAIICPNCGISQKHEPDNDDKGGFLWGLLGFFVPLVGLILFLVWRESKPKTAKAVGKGALINVILSVFLFVLFTILSISMFATYQ